MPATYSITEAQARFPAIVRESEEELVTITRRDEVVGYLVSPDRMAAIVETMELLANPQLVQAVRDYEAGRLDFVALEEVSD